MAAMLKLGNRGTTATLLSWLAVLAVLITAFLAIRNHGSVIDEYHHFLQINTFLHGQATLDPELTTLPGYHLLVCGIAVLVRASSYPDMRLVNFLLSLFTILVFYASAKRFSDNPQVRMLQFSFLPLLFPFFFLIYTDVTALLFVLLALYLWERGYRSWGYCFSLLSILVRQQNVVWLLFLLAWDFTETYGYRFVAPALVKRYLLKNWLGVLILLGFGGFALLHGGISMGHQKFHPSFNLSTGNIFFFLFLSFFLFAPLGLADLGERWRLLVRHRVVVLFFMVGLTLLYTFSFQADNPLNQFDFHLRNKMLHYLTANSFNRFVGFVPIALAALYFATTSFKRPAFYLLYPFSVALLAPSWLIEQRYYLVPAALFMLFRPAASRSVEYAVAALYLGLSLYCFDGILHGRFFL
ncbi:MAG: hypothetical protein WCI38_05535 [Chthoniobacterales bacterium]